MQFLVTMRDGATFTVEAAYIEVVRAPRSTYTFLGPVPGYPIAILAAFPTEVVAAVRPLDQAEPGPAPPQGAGSGQAARSQAARPPLPPIAAADV